MWGRSSWPLLPILIPQAIWVAARAARLPEAAGPRSGVLGHGPPLRLLIVGDSSAAGVGAKTQDEALTGHIVRRLSQTRRVEWKLVARSGATSADVAASLNEVAWPKVDAAIVSVGVNDAKNGVVSIRWMRGVGQILARFRREFDVDYMLVAGIPPIGEFPILPMPLRSVLGERGRQFDALLQEVAQANGAHHVGFDFPLDVADMAPDGFHPGPKIYATWAAHLGDVLIEAIEAS